MWNEKGNEWILNQAPAPISNIEFKVIHLAECRQMYDNYAFKKGTLNWNELECLEWPPSIDYLKKTHIRLIESLKNLTDEQLKDKVPTNWVDLCPIKKIISTMIQHDAYHYGQICTVRNLYRIKHRKKT